MVLLFRPNDRLPFLHLADYRNFRSNGFSLCLATINKREKVVYLKFEGFKTDGVKNSTVLVLNEVKMDEIIGLFSLSSFAQLSIF